MTDICILCKANPQRNCDCRAPKVSQPPPSAKLIIDELDELEFTGTWDIYYTDVDRDKRPRCIVRSDGMMVFATVFSTAKPGATPSAWGVGVATKARVNRRYATPSGYFITAKEAMEWVDKNIVENPKPIIVDFYSKL